MARNPLMGSTRGRAVTSTGSGAAPSQGGMTAPFSNGFGGATHPAAGGGAAPGVVRDKNASATQAAQLRSKGRVRGRSRLRGHANRSGGRAVINAMRGMVRNATPRGQA